MCLNWFEKSNSGSRVVVLFFFFQAEDGIRDAQESRGLGDVYKRQGSNSILVIIDSTR